MEPKKGAEPKKEPAEKKGEKKGEEKRGQTQNIKI
jgi:hypothetical protein